MIFRHDHSIWRVKDAVCPTQSCRKCIDKRLLNSQECLLITNHITGGIIFDKLARLLPAYYYVGHIWHHNSHSCSFHFARIRKRTKRTGCTLNVYISSPSTNRIKLPRTSKRDRNFSCVNVKSADRDRFCYWPDKASERERIAAAEREGCSFHCRHYRVTSS